MAHSKSNGTKDSSAILANRSMSSIQSRDCPARSAMKTPEAKPQSLQWQRDIRRALIAADLVDRTVAYGENGEIGSQAIERLIHKLH
jgi:hypothetical protein